MILSALIEKGGLTGAMTATPATTATQEAANSATVAPVATVAVAEKPEPLPELSPDAESNIRAWLAHIGETDPANIAEVLGKCRADTGARADFLRRAEKVPKPLTFDDDRRYCAECANLTSSGLCLAARRGEITASRTFHPVDHLPRRCKGYAPGPNDSDRRPGRERWPNLHQKGGNHADD